jgi:hypothetical protein
MHGVRAFKTYANVIIPEGGYNTAVDMVVARGNLYLFDYENINIPEIITNLLSQAINCFELKPYK